MRHPPALLAALGLLAVLAVGCPKKAPPADDGTGTKGAAAHGKGKAPKGKDGQGEVKGAPTDDDLFREAMATTDPKVRVQKLEQLLERRGDEADARQFLHTRLVQAYAEVGNIEKMESSAAQITINDDYEGAQIKNAMAYAYADKGQNLDKSRKLIMSALNTLDAMEADGPPPQAEVAPEDFREFIEENRGYFLDTMGWIELKGGKTKEAVAVLEEATRRVDHSTIRFHLGEAYRTVGDIPNAAKAYARAAVLESDDSDKAKAALEQLAKEGKVDAKAALDAAKKEHDAEAAKKKADEAAREEREKAARTARAARDGKMAKERALGGRQEDDTPDFAMATLDGKTVDNAGLTRQVTVLDFWATWCGPCRQELPIYQGLFERYKGRVNFLAVSVDESKDEAEDYIKEGNYSFPVAHDTGSVARSFRITGLPTIVVIGPCGRINWIHRGFNPQIEVVLGAQIEALLAETNASCEK